MVVIQHIFEFKCWVKLSLFLSLIFFFNNGIPLSFLYKSPNKFLWSMSGFGTPVMRLGLRPTPVLRLRSPWEPSSKSKWNWPTSWPLWRGHIWVPKPFWRVQRPKSRTSASNFIWLRLNCPSRDSWSWTLRPSCKKLKTQLGWPGKFLSR